MKRVQGTPVAGRWFLVPVRKAWIGTVIPVTKGQVLGIQAAGQSTGGAGTAADTACDREPPHPCESDRRVASAQAFPAFLAFLSRRFSLIDFCGCFLASFFRPCDLAMIGLPEELACTC